MTKKEKKMKKTILIFLILFSFNFLVAKAGFLKPKYHCCSIENICCCFSINYRVKESEYMTSSISIWDRIHSEDISATDYCKSMDGFISTSDKCNDGCFQKQTFEFRS